MERIIYGDETLMAAASCFKMLLPTPFPNAGVHFNKPPPILFTAPPPDPTLDALSSDPTRNPRYKTEICRNFKERARCIYGDQVIFRLLYFHYLLNFNILLTTLICSSFILKSPVTETSMLKSFSYPNSNHAFTILYKLCYYV